MEPLTFNENNQVVEYARLVDEIQRLRQEREQRSSELAIIKSVQQGLASKLDMDGIYELVGENIREIFQDVDVTVLVGQGHTHLQPQLEARVDQRDLARK